MTGEQLAAHLLIAVVAGATPAVTAWWLNRKIDDVHQALNGHVNESKGE